MRLAYVYIITGVDKGHIVKKWSLTEGHLFFTCNDKDAIKCTTNRKIMTLRVTLHRRRSRYMKSEICKHYLIDHQEKKTSLTNKKIMTMRVTPHRRSSRYMKPEFCKPHLIDY